MIKNSIEKLSDSIGFEIGTSDDVTQAKLINSFCEGLNASIRDKHNLDMQICYIVNKLDKRSEDILMLFVEFIKCKKQK